MWKRQTKRAPKATTSRTSASVQLRSEKGNMAEAGAEQGAKKGPVNELGAAGGAARSGSESREREGQRRRVVVVGRRE
jgi:hypothetical protein